MRKRFYLVTALSLILVASAPLNASAEALNDSFYSAQEVDENVEIEDFGEIEDEFISDDITEGDLFSSQAEEYSTGESNDSADDGWTQLENESKISFKYDSESKTLSFRASEPAALPDNNQDGSCSEWYLKNKEVKNATKVVIGDNITRIGAFNFDNHLSAYPNVNTVELSSSVKEIGLSAFSKISTLQNVNLESVEAIGNNAFEQTSIEKVILNQNSVSIGNSAFEYCSALKEVTVKGSVNIGESSFYECTQLNSFSCDSAISLVNSKAFYDCSALNLFKATSVENVGDYAFLGCTSLNEFDFSETKTIGSRSFRRSGIVKANFAVLNEIGTNALASCSKLTSICYHGSKEDWDTIAEYANYPDTVAIHYKADTVEAKDPTCTEPGRKGTNVCDVCGENYSAKDDEESVIPALGHSFSDEYTVDKTATCTEEGEQSKHCTREGCDAKEDVQKIDALGHDYVETTVAPTCTEKGTLTKTCSRCNDVVTEEIPALGHDFAKDYTVDVKATCTTDGKQSKHCSRCDAKTDEQKIPALGHDFTSKVTKEATCTVDGVITKTCSRCDATEIEAIKALGHKFGDWKVTAEATVLAPEQQERICETCGAKETKAEGTALKATATVNATTVKLKVKQSTSGLKVTGLAKGDSVKSWKSTNTKIFTVKGKENGTCKLTAKKAGTAKLQITLASGLKKTVTVKVQKTAVKTTKVTVANTKVTVKKGKKVALKPVVKPFTSKQKVTYTSSNKKVATVSSKGVVTGKKKGTAKITVKSGSKSVKVTVKVK